ARGGYALAVAARAAGAVVARHARVQEPVEADRGHLEAPPVVAALSVVDSRVTGGGRVGRDVGAGRARDHVLPRSAVGHREGARKPGSGRLGGGTIAEPWMSPGLHVGG